MIHIKFDSSKLTKFVHDNELGEMQAMVNAADEQLRQGIGQIGAIFGPLLIGILMDHKIGINFIFIIFMISLIIGALAVLALPAPLTHSEVVNQ